MTGQLLSLGRTDHYSTVVAAQGLDNSLLFFWNNDGDVAWNSSRIDGPGTTFAAPALVRTDSESTVIAVQGPNNSLNFYWNSDGDPTWHKSTIAGRGTAYSAPAICRTDEDVTIVMCRGPGNHLIPYYNCDGDAQWNLLPIRGIIIDDVQNSPVMATLRLDSGDANATSIEAIALYGSDHNGIKFFQFSADTYRGGFSIEVMPALLATGFGTPALVFNTSNNWALVALRTSDNGLNWYWTEGANAPWHPSAIAPAGTTYSDPSIGRTDHNSSVVAAVGPNNSLKYYWNNDGDANWNASEVAGANSTFSAPASGRVKHEATIIAVRGPLNQVLFYWNNDGDPTWHSSVIGNL